MELTVENWWMGAWRKSATVTLVDPSAGHLSPSIVDYDIDYFADHAAAERNMRGDVFDARAVSVRYPVDLASRYRTTWPPFLLDLMPQGRARRMLAEHIGVPYDAKSGELPLLMRAAGNPVGNIRIAEAAAAQHERMARIERVGLTEDDIFGRSDRFEDARVRLGLYAAGDACMQGEWPKIAMTLARDGFYYPDAFVSDEEAVRHVIVKTLRSDHERDRMILEAEAGYSRLVAGLGLDVAPPSRHDNGVLMMPRFDRSTGVEGVSRHGQESLVSAIGVTAFGHLASHEEYIGLIRDYSDDPIGDVAEYVKRDIANRALGNTDNHGRNTALTKRADGSVRLAPLFDFAPMRMAPESVARSTRWASMRATFRDGEPDWREVCEGIYPDSEANADRLMEEIGAFACGLRGAVEIACDLGIPREVVDFAMRHCVDVADAVTVSVAKPEASQRP